MLVASYRNTERGARPKLAIVDSQQHEEQVRVIDLIAKRREEMRKAMEADEQRLVELKAEQARIKAEVDAMIAAGNEALRNLQEQWAIDQRRERRKISRTVAAPLTIDTVMRRICRVLKMNVNDVLSDRKSREVTFCRQAICYWASRRTAHSLPVIGRRLNRDHTTVMHGRDMYIQKRERMGRHLRKPDRSTAST